MDKRRTWEHAKLHRNCTLENFGNGDPELWIISPTVTPLHTV